MKVILREIPLEGLVVETEEPPSLIAEKPEGKEAEDIKFVKPFMLKAKIDKTPDTLIAFIEINSTYQSFCSRCLIDVIRDFECSFLLDFPITRQTEYVEFSEDIRQEIILSLPNRILCQEDCKGLCPKCGNNLNKAKCLCDDEQPG